MAGRDGAVVLKHWHRTFTGRHGRNRRRGGPAPEGRALDVPASLAGPLGPAGPQADNRLLQARAGARREKKSRSARHAVFTILGIVRPANFPEMRAGIFARDILRLPVRLVFTSAAQRRHSLLPRWLIARMDAVIATTPEAARFVPGVRTVAPHGVETDSFHPAASRRTAWTDTPYPGEAGIAAIGRIRPEKGTDRFVAAMIQALPLLPGHTALVIGKAASEHAAFLTGLKSQVAAAGLEDRILFPGEIGPDTMPALVRGLSLLVALPRYEGYGVTPLEAMASGVPFVASDAGWFEEFSGGNAAGLVIPEGDPGRAADEIVAILSDPERHAGMATAARARAVDRFSVAAEAEAINAVYAALWAEA